VLVNDVIKSIFKDRDDKHLHLTQEWNSSPAALDDVKDD
jgi:hypothetical protein